MLPSWASLFVLLATSWTNLALMFLYLSSKTIDFATATSPPLCYLRTFLTLFNNHYSSLWPFPKSWHKPAPCIPAESLLCRNSSSFHTDSNQTGLGTPQWPCFNLIIYLLVLSPMSKSKVQGSKIVLTYTFWKIIQTLTLEKYVTIINHSTLTQEMMCQGSEADFEGLRRKGNGIRW